jgi:anti-sigma-K factor RskA
MSAEASAADAELDSQIEAYVLDQLSPAERLQVERALAADPALQQRKEELEHSLELIAFAGAVAPPHGLRERVMARVGAPEPVHSVVIPMWGVWAAAASLLLLAAVGIYLTSTRIARVETELAAVRESNERLTQHVNQTSIAATNLKTEFRLTSAGYRRIELTATPTSPGGSAVVFWSADEGETYFVGQLPPVPAGKQYQLWALHNGQPIDAGVLGVIPNGILEPMQKIPKADAFAVTMEPAGGSPSPTTTAMMVMGKVN